jgi:hypothetical protein
MLSRVSNCLRDQAVAPSTPVAVENVWNRNEKEDMKKAIDLIYEFSEALSKLHPHVKDYVEKLFQQNRY